MWFVVLASKLNEGEMDERNIIFGISLLCCSPLRSIQAIKMIEADLKRAKQGDSRTPAVCIMSIKIEQRNG